MSKVVLRKINELDTANIVRWRNSESVKMNLFTQSELSAEQHLDWLCVMRICCRNDVAGDTQSCGKTISPRWNSFVCFIGLSR